MAAETGFLIDGTMYEVPPIDTFTMDEAQVLYDYSGLTLEDFVGVGDEEGESKFKNPGFLRALMHVAYQRGNPRVNPQRVRTLVGSANMVEALEQLAASADAEDDAGPPASTTEPNESSPKSSVGSNENSGTPSKDDSEGQVVLLAPTTGGSTPRSESEQKTSVR